MKNRKVVATTPKSDEYNEELFYDDYTYSSVNYLKAVNAKWCIKDGRIFIEYPEDRSSSYYYDEFSENEHDKVIEQLLPFLAEEELLK